MLTVGVLIVLDKWELTGGQPLGLLVHILVIGTCLVISLVF